MAIPGDDGWVIPPRWWRWAGTRGGLMVFAWLFGLGVGGRQLHRAWHAFDTDNHPAGERRADGNSGHTQIDFGGQWVMARMLVSGHGRGLYHRNRQWEVAREGYSVAAEPPAAREESVPPLGDRKWPAKEDPRHDADAMLWWFMGEDSPQWKTVGGAAAAPVAAPPLSPLGAAALQLAAAEAVTPAVAAEVVEPRVGGPLYPPVHAFFYAPLALLPPQQAYSAFQVVLVGLAFAAGAGVQVLSRGRIWCPLAAAFLLVYPGCHSGIDLGQNPTVTAAILVWGWALAARGRDGAGGAVWGLLAFKPTWGLAFALAPLVMRRWRFCFAMVLTGAGLAAATLPVVGVQSWRDWLTVGKQASELYKVNKNWIDLGRHLDSIPRRLLIDTEKFPEKDRNSPAADAIGWGLIGGVVVVTAGVYLLRADRRRAVGVGAGFAFLGAFLSCYRFMYYDVLLSAVGVFVLCGDPRRFLRATQFDPTPRPADTPGPGRGLPPPPPPPRGLGPRAVGYVASFPLTVVVLMLLLENHFQAWVVEATVGAPQISWATTGKDGETGATYAKVGASTSVHYAWDTALVVVLWAWCGWRLLWGEERENGEPGA